MIAPTPREEIRRFARSVASFMAIGLLLFVGIFLASEWLVYEHAHRNRFFVVKTAPPVRSDFVILGASHGAVFDYRDMNARLEEMTGAEVLNLATVGGGIAINRLLLEYFLQEHETGAVVYVLDSFGFYSDAWNEERLRDRELYARAPWDPRLGLLLLRHPGARSMALDYMLGFSKVNNPDRFLPDVFEAEASRFDRTYRAIPQIDRQRLAFLYPGEIDETTLLESPYLAAFEDLIRYVQAQGSRFIVVRPPIPERVYSELPWESTFDETIKALVERHGAEFHDFSRVANEPEFFYDTDHLNEAGVLNFFERYFSDVLLP
jgi:hypothetical protein